MTFAHKNPLLGDYILVKFHCLLKPGLIKKKLDVRFFVMERV